MTDYPPAGKGASAVTSEAPSSPDSGLAPVDRRIFVVAAAVLALLMAFSARYGIYRDELYFLDGARHLSLSYVDQPIFTPLVARLSLDLFGVSVVGLRLWPALAANRRCADRDDFRGDSGSQNGLPLRKLSHSM